MVTLKTIGNSLRKARRIIRSKPLRILDEPRLSEKWLIDEAGTKIRLVCGTWNPVTGYPCMLPAGFGTNHFGKGSCRKHSRGGLYNIVLNEENGYPARLKELLIHTESLDETELIPVENDIKLLYALQQYTMGMGINEVLSLDQIETIRKITLDIIKAKSIKHKIQREMKLDNTTVKEFVHQIFHTIAENIKGPEAKRLMEDIMNKVIIPFQSTDRLSGNEGLNEEKIHKFLG